VFLDDRLVALLVVPLITMRLFAEERKARHARAPLDVAGA